LEPHESVCCPLVGVDREIATVRQQFIGTTCHADLRFDEAEEHIRTECPEVHHTRTAVESSCLCKIFNPFGCIPNIADVTDDTLIFETYLPDRTILTDIVEELERVVENLRLRQLKRIERTNDVDRGAVVRIDLSELTELQRETAMRAVESGYYSNPRETSFAELADMLNISKSALSKRLAAVEAKLAKATFETR
jgi:predicted DNA binding protein